METCLIPGALELFLSSLDASIVEIVSATEVIVHATVGDVSWQWLESEGVFCVDGLLGFFGDPV